jgi:arsenate reductase
MPADPIYNVLFLCTGNSARSVFGEVLINALAGHRFRGFSAGSHPRGDIHPMTLELLREAGLPTEGLRSKSWEEFALAGAPVMDFVFTVCDEAAGEPCPIWPGQPMTAHWGIEDPARAVGSPLLQRAAFRNALDHMRNRVAAFSALPLASIDRLALRTKLQEIGRLEGSTSHTGSAA